MADIAHIAGLIAAGAASQPGAVLRRRHEHDAQDPHGPAGRHHHVPRRVRRGDRPRRVPRHAGRPADARHRRQGGVLRIAQSEEFHKLQRQIVENCAVLAETLAEGGLRLVSGGTDVHLALVDLRSTGINGLECQELLERSTSRPTATWCRSRTTRSTSPAGCASARRRSRRGASWSPRCARPASSCCAPSRRARRRRGARRDPPRGHRSARPVPALRVPVSGAGDKRKPARRAQLGRVLPPARPPGGDALDLPAPPGGRRAGARQAHPRDRLQRRPARRRPLPRHRLPARAARHPVGRAPRALPRHPRRAERRSSRPPSTASPSRAPTLYCTHHPCILCAKILINCGVREIHYLEGYPDELSREMLEEAGVPASRSSCHRRDR